MSEREIRVTTDPERSMHWLRDRLLLRADDMRDVIGDLAREAARREGIPEDLIDGMPGLSARVIEAVEGALPVGATAIVGDFAEIRRARLDGREIDPRAFVVLRDDTAAPDGG